MITGIVIPQDERSSLEERAFDGLSDYKAEVGGWVGAIHIEHPSMTLFVNEEGKIRGLPRNPRATALWWLLSPSVRQMESIVGDAVLVGSYRGLGSATNLPKPFHALLVDTARYQVETTNERGRWERDAREFVSYFEAAIYAILLLEQTSPAGRVSKVRVVAA